MPGLIASKHGLAKIKQARNEKGWNVDDPQWLVEASKLLEPDKNWEVSPPFASNISEGTWKAFLYGTRRIHTSAFKAYCQVLGLSWDEICDRVAESDRVHPTPDNRQDTHPINQSAEKRVLGLEALPSVPVWKGRDELLEKLKAKLLEPGTSLKVLALIGQGGIGKTSLAVKLLEALSVNLSSRTISTDSPYECVMYFKAQEGTSFDDVAEFLLKVGLGIETAEPLKNVDEKIAKIIEGLAKTRCLLVLDNLKTILHPANHSQAGRAISPDWGKLLNALVYQQHCSQTILTSREVPADLADRRYEGLEPDSELVHIETLTGVETEAGVEILRQRQLKDKPEDLQWVSERVEGHVFLLTQLAAIGKGKLGYLRKHPELVTKKAEPILREQLERQSESARDLLRRMCVLRVGIDIEGLTFLRLYTDDREKDDRFMRAAELGKPAEFTDEEKSETEAIVERLVDSSLVQSRYDEEKCEIFYDLHRVIVEFLRARFQKELPDLIISTYLLYLAGRNVENPKSLDELRPVLEAQFFAFLLGDYRNAAKLLMETLETYLRRWGYWNLLKDLYERVLPHLDELDRPSCLKVVGQIYLDFGNCDVAEKYLQDAIVIEQEQQDDRGIHFSLLLLDLIEKRRKEWYCAEQAGYAAERYLRHLRGELDTTTEFTANSDSLVEIESKQDGLNELERQNQEILQALQARQEALQARQQASQARQKALQEMKETEKYLQLSKEAGDDAGIARAMSLLGKVELYRGNLKAAERLLTAALAKMQELRMALDFADTLYKVAQLELRRSNTQLAQQYCETARQIFQQLGAVRNLEQCECMWRVDLILTNPDLSQPVQAAEGAVCSYDELLKVGCRDDNLTPHHIPTNAFMEAKVPGYTRNKGIAIMMERLSPESDSCHRPALSYGQVLDLSLSPRQALARGVKNMRSIYRSQALYTWEIRHSLQQVIQQNKAVWQCSFDKGKV